MSGGGEWWGGGRRGGHTRRKVCVVGPDENKVGTRGARLPSSAGETWRAGAPSRLIAAGGDPGGRRLAGVPGLAGRRSRAGDARGLRPEPRGSAATRPGETQLSAAADAVRSCWGSAPLRWAAAGSFNIVSLQCFKHSNPKPNPKPLTRKRK